MEERNGKECTYEIVAGDAGLTEQTDEKHGLTMKEILEWITEKGIAGERKSVYEDIHALQEFGLPIVYCTEIRHTDFSNKSDAVRSE